MTMKTTFDDSVAVIRMERGRGNAIDDGFVAELNGALDEVEASDARAAVVTGAGADRSASASTRWRSAFRFRPRYPRSLRAIRERIGKAT